MSVIKVMSENLANKIAAGEVVEKCANVVKELVENSIDANAKNIKINLLKGGLEQIEVIDDGVGMDKDDAILAFERHATSKIYKDDDLFFIDTLGFRGEALPSIASVSEVELSTCKDEVGTFVHIKGGETLEVGNSQSKIGTSVKVTNLFYNTPARLKHLKSPEVELSYATSYIERLALAKPNISFTLTNNQNVAVKTSGSGNLLKVIHEIYGMQISSKMLEVSALSDDFEIKGYISKPEVLKSNRNHLITIINGRVVKNYDVNKAINDAYYTYKPDGKYPVVVLLIDTDPTLVDVNIHPTKQDIKISKMNDLYDLIYNTIKDRLYDSLLIPDALGEEKRKEEGRKIKEGFIPLNKTDFKDIAGEQTVLEGLFKEEINDSELNKIVFRVLGVSHETYIVCEGDDGLYLFDQHAAHERIYYEKYLKELEEEKVITTELLVPINIELTSSEFGLFNKYKDVFNELGFEYETFGINTIGIRKQPIWLKKGKEEENIRKIVDILISEEGKFDKVKFRNNVAQMLACKNAVKAHDHLSNDEIDRLLKDLVKCENPYNCAHGRPTMVKFSSYDLDKMFKRTGNC